MKHTLKNKLIFIIIFAMGTIYGIIIQKYEIFPYRIIKYIYANIYHRHYPNVYSQWSIGLYEGYSIYELDAPNDISNPILTQKDVNDIDAEFVADPFFIIKDNKYYTFFEIMN